MPWQRYVADVALEYDPVTGRLWYREVDLTVPRQSGKTTEILAVAVDRALSFGGRQNIVYTAQTRNDARLKWEEEHVAILERSIFGPMFRVKLANGQESIRWRNGSRHGITATTEKSGHGPTLDLGFVDEAFAQVDARTEQAMKPSMITRPEPQLWVASTAGTETSTYLRGKVKAGRRRVESGVPSRIAYFEWSAPDEADPGDPAVWRACMPALGHTITEDAIRAEYESMRSELLAEFQRAYLNQWVDRSLADLVIPLEWWAQCADPSSVITGPVVFAVDVAPDHAWASIGVAGWRPDGLPHGELEERHADTGWVV
jgi:phage terminase large subunit-like protein